jgi:hypothetical protein
VLKKDFVCVAINNNNKGAALDGQNGAFMGLLNCRFGNYMQVVVADGQVLSEGELSNVNADVGGVLGNGWKKWRALPETARKPGGIKLPPPTSTDREELLKPPPGGLILRVYQRDLQRDAKGEIARISKEALKNRQLFPDDNWQWGNAVMTEPMPDVMWLTEAEWKALIPANPKIGDQFDVPSSVKMRLFRYHLINGTYGLPEGWWPSAVHRGELTLTVEEVSPVLRLRLRGSALMEADKRGYDTKLTGVLEYDATKKAFTRFDVVAVGDWWGGDREANRFIRPGRTPLGIALELASGDRPSDFVPPKGQPFKDIRNSYFAAEK